MGGKEKQVIARDPSIKTHKDLDAWKVAMAWVEKVYQVTSHFPKEEMYGLTLQTRRYAVSVPSNMAEGPARNSAKVFVQFLYVALGSLAELETQLMIADRLIYTNDSEVCNRVVETRRFLLGLIRYAKQKSPST